VILVESDGAVGGRRRGERKAPTAPSPKASFLHTLVPAFHFRCTTCTFDGNNIDVSAL